MAESDGRERRRGDCLDGVIAPSPCRMRVARDGWCGARVARGVPADTGLSGRTVSIAWIEPPPHAFGRARLKIARARVQRSAQRSWLAEVPTLSGALAHGRTREEAVARVEALALRIQAERLEQGEPTPELDAAFEAA